ncbi:hypothetical protein BpHYR1_009917 [Brachionus plicatilis]|uniref:Uncharacterized protein n=1 Tax=Brachionus plicatilis TaxID=10195 RepID=A0A3M7QPI5_BRAPC|nr:hypothetical protein BpHYR1_009917 [Brachionus plicatilis]
MVGNFNYFATHAGKVSTFSRILLNNPKDISKSDLIYQLLRNVITKFKTFGIPDDPVQYHLVSDATTNQFGFIINSKCALAGQFNRELPITFVETITVLIALKKFCDHAEEDSVSIICQIDKTGTIAAIKKNRRNISRQRIFFETRVTPYTSPVNQIPQTLYQGSDGTNTITSGFLLKNSLRNGSPSGEQYKISKSGRITGQIGAARIPRALKRQSSKSEKLLSKKQKLPLANPDVHVDETQLADSSIPPFIRTNDGIVELELINSQKRDLSAIPSLRDELDEHELNFEGTRYQQAFIPVLETITETDETQNSTIETTEEIGIPDLQSTWTSEDEEVDPLLLEWPQPLKYRRIETEEDIKSEIQDMTWPENRPPIERFTKSQSMPNIRLRRSKSKQDNFEDPDFGVESEIVTLIDELIGQIETAQKRIHTTFVTGYEEEGSPPHKLFIKDKNYVNESDEETETEIEYET